jgi:DNA repair exonuclease SbcCD ATPase subunit
MHVILNDFAAFRGGPRVLSLQSKTAENGGGKTTLVNAYYWALTGRTLNGFDVIPAGADRQNVSTAVTVEGFAGLSIRRELTPKGTQLYVNGHAVTQTDFVRAMMDKGVDVEFAAACADVNALADPQVTADQLRRVLVRADVMDNGEADQLRKTLRTLRADKETAERYALANVTIPVETCEPLTEAERVFLSDYNHDVEIVNKGLECVCPACKRAYTEERVREIKFAYSEACAVMTSKRNEAARIAAKLDTYNEEQQRIADAKRMVEASKRARDNVRELERRIAETEAEIREADRRAVQAELPDGWQLVTDKTLKTGRTTGTFTLTYNGVPLKSVNRASRVKLCITLLSSARASRGMDEFPIIVDNAESVQNVDTPNVVLLRVG